MIDPVEDSDCLVVSDHWLISEDVQEQFDGNK